MKRQSGAIITRHTCDQCQRELVPVEDGGFWPLTLSAGWGHTYLDLIGESDAEKHFCSDKCLRAFLDENSDKHGEFVAPTRDYVITSSTNVQIYKINATEG